MNKCDKCGGIHWRTAPCILPRVRIGTDGLTAKETPKSSVSAEPPHHEVHTQSTAAKQSRSSRSRSANESLPVDNSRARKKALAGEMPSVNEQPETVGKLVQVQQSGPATKFDRKAWMRDYQRNYMRNVYRPKLKASKSNPNTPERNDK